MGAEAAKALFPEASFLARPGASEGESAFLTAAMKRPELEEKLRGTQVLSLFRVL